MRLHQRRHRQAGQVLIIAALMVLIMVSGILVGIDMGRLVQARIAFQNGADAAALAAVAVKVGKHHFDTAWRWSMQQEVYKARTSIIWANLILIDTLLDLQQNPITPVGPINGGGPINGPPGPGPLPGPADPGVGVKERMQKAKMAFADKANKAYIYAAKLKEMDKTLFKLYQDWPEVHAEGAARAARIAWQMNIGEFASERSPSGRPNGALMLSQADLLENQNGMTIGGFAYANERAGGAGLYGKSLVEMTCGVVPFSLSFNGLTRVAKQYTIRVNAGAQPVPQLDGAPVIQGDNRYNLSKNTPIGGLPVGPKMAWLAPMLFSITGSEEGPLH
jgi:hypothetical protein